MKASFRHASSAVSIGKPKVITWTGNNLLLEYSDMLLEARIMINVAAKTRLFLSFYMFMTIQLQFQQYWFI
jgi:hypothetical protein